MRRCSLLSSGKEREAYLQCFMYDGCVKCPYYERVEDSSSTKTDYFGVLNQNHNEIETTPEVNDSNVTEVITDDSGNS